MITDRNERELPVQGASLDRDNLVLYMTCTLDVRQPASGPLCDARKISHALRQLVKGHGLRGVVLTITTRSGDSVHEGRMASDGEETVCWEYAAECRHGQHK